MCDHGMGLWKKGKNVKSHEDSAKHQKAVQNYNVLRDNDNGQTRLQRLEEPRLQLATIQQGVNACNSSEDIVLP